MGSSNQHFLRNEYGLRYLNQKNAVGQTDFREPGAVYRLPDLTIEMYDTPYKDLDDMTHDFRTYTDFIMEFSAESWDGEHGIFLGGTWDSFEKLDNDLIDMIESAERNKFYKEIR